MAHERVHFDGEWEWNRLWYYDILAIMHLLLAFCPILALPNSYILKGLRMCGTIAKLLSFSFNLDLLPFWFTIYTNLRHYFYLDL